MMDPSRIDPNTLAVAGIAAHVFKDPLNRLLGPTADYIGGEVKGLVAKCNVNLGRIFTHAIEKLGPRIDQPGAVNPRVLRHVWSEGAFVEDELAAEYFGGLLASARSPDGRDDRVLSLRSTVRDLSSYDLRLHHLIYSLVRAKGVGSKVSLAVSTHRMEAMVRITFRDYAMVMGIPGDDDEVMEFARQSLLMLDRYGLVADHDPSGTSRLPLAEYKEDPRPAMSISPSQYGAKLFLWAYGHSDKRIDQIFDPSIDLPTSADLPTTPEAGTGV